MGQTMIWMNLEIYNKRKKNKKNPIWQKKSLLFSENVFSKCRWVMLVYVYLFVRVKDKEGFSSFRLVRNEYLDKRFVLDKCELFCFLHRHTHTQLEINNIHLLFKCRQAAHINVQLYIYIYTKSSHLNFLQKYYKGKPTVVGLKDMQCILQGGCCECWTLVSYVYVRTLTSFKSYNIETNKKNMYRHLELTNLSLNGSRGGRFMISASAAS